jgi:hypothetical protein
MITDMLAAITELGGYIAIDASETCFAIARHAIDCCNIMKPKGISIFIHRVVRKVGNFIDTGASTVACQTAGLLLRRHHHPMQRKKSQEEVVRPHEKEVVHTEFSATVAVRVALVANC